MGTFRDTENREWRLRLTAGLATRIREATGANVLLSATREGLSKWDGYEMPLDPERFVAALWVLVERQAKDRGVTRDAFEDAFDEATYRQAHVAFYEMILSFSPMPAFLKTVFGTGEEMVRRLTSTASDGVTNSAGPSGSTPASSPSAS